MSGVGVAAEGHVGVHRVELPGGVLVGVLGVRSSGMGGLPGSVRGGFSWVFSGCIRRVRRTMQGKKWLEL